MPGAPSPDHEWHDQSKRWKLSAAATAKANARAAALAAIQAMDAKSIMIKRELALGVADAVDRLAGIEAVIAAERANLCESCPGFFGQVDKWKDCYIFG